MEYAVWVEVKKDGGKKTKRTRGRRCRVPREAYTTHAPSWLGKGEKIQNNRKIWEGSTARTTRTPALNCTTPDSRLPTPLPLGFVQVYCLLYLRFPSSLFHLPICVLNSISFSGVHSHYTFHLVNHGASCKIFFIFIANK